MLQNASQVQQLLITNDLGKPAQVGYDLTLKSVNLIGGGTVTKEKTLIDDYHEVMMTKDAKGRFVYQLAPGKAYSLTFEQGIKLDNKHTAMIKQRSSVLRCGAIITSGIYDPGFQTDNIGAVMFTYNRVVLEKGARVAQVYMFENTESELYEGQFQGKADVK